MTTPTPLEEIDIVVFDFDGVFTDNRVWVLQDGTEAVACDRRDGMGIEMLRNAGIEAAVLSRETNPVVAARCEKLDLPAIHGEKDKLPTFEKMLEERGLSSVDAAYVGNDVNDLECLDAAGLGVAVQDAHPSVLDRADLVLERAGGNAAVRELCEKLCSAQDSPVMFNE